MAKRSSLAAATDPLPANLLFSTIGVLVLGAGLLAVAVGPLGLLLLLAVPVQAWLGARVLRERSLPRERAKRLARDGRRGIATVTAAEPASSPARGGQDALAVTARVEPPSGAAFDARDEVFWSDARPGATGLAAYDGSETLLYFAAHPETTAELERRFNLETSLPAREPELPDRPL